MLLYMKMGACTEWGLIALLLAGCGDAPATPVASEDLLEMSSDMVGYETRTILTTDGVKSGLIEADTTYFFEDSTLVHMNGVDMVTYTDQGAVRATITADRGRYDQRTQQMHAQGNVVLILPDDGRRLESPELHYDPESQRIWSDSATTYLNASQVTRGSCFKSDMTFRNITVCDIRGAADVGG